MAYLTKAKEQNAQNEKTDQTKKKKVSVILIEFDCELHYHMQEMPKSSLPLPPKSGWDVFREEQYSNVVNEGYNGKDIASTMEKLEYKSLLRRKSL